MGNLTSSLNKNTNTEHSFNKFDDAIDYIASKYILTSDFQSLKKLSEKEYCEKLVVLTSDIIDRYFNHQEITYLEQRVKNGLEVNDMTEKKVYYLNKDQLNDLDISNDRQKEIKKKRVCIGIAKFYVKIAHIFAAILMTINPVYLYKDPITGTTIRKSIYNKHQIPTSVKTKMNWNFCDNRINRLKKGQDYHKIDESGNIQVNPDICSSDFSEPNSNSLFDEPGMKELEELYYDKYDYSTGKFTGMSEKTANQYENDLKTFYYAFTGNKIMPPEIKKFADIKIKSYEKTKGCQGSFKQSYHGSVKNKNGTNSLFHQYAMNIKEMILQTNENQNKLLNIIFQIFNYVIEPFSGEKKFVFIQP